MDNILNKTGIKNYSKRFSQQVLDDFFINKKVINGAEIKTLTDIQQVNLFVIKHLFDAWEEEVNNLKSPYFNYEKPEVKAALKTFMNTLSRHIEIDREHFEPILNRAVEESILLIFSPFDFYAHFTEQYSGDISIKNLNAVTKYIKVNKGILDAVIVKLEKENEIDFQKFNASLNEVLHEIESGPEDIDTYFDQFNAVEPLAEEDIYGELEKISDDNKTVASEQNETPTINDAHVNEDQNLAEALASKSVESLKNSLSINQKYMFLSVLFANNENTMNDTFDKIDGCKSKKEVMDFLIGEFPHWNIEGEEFEEFVHLLDKKFG